MEYAVNNVFLSKTSDIDAANATSQSQLMLSHLAASKVVLTSPSLQLWIYETTLSLRHDAKLQAPCNIYVTQYHVNLFDTLLSFRPSTTK